MRKRTLSEAGITLSEAVIALLLLGVTVAGMLTSFVMGRISASHARYHAQAMNQLQAEAEELTAGPYEDVGDQALTQVMIDPGPDLQEGTSDDLFGGLLVEVGDRFDLDADGDTTEEEIDVDGDGVNDPCKPVRVSLTRTFLSFAGPTSVTVSLDTLIAKR